MAKLVQKNAIGVVWRLRFKLILSFSSGMEREVLGSVKLQ